MNLSGLKSDADATQNEATGLSSHFQRSGTIRDFAISYCTYLADLLSGLDLDAIERITQTIEAAGERGGTIYCMGNGGSAASAAHFVNDLSIGTRAPGAIPLRAVSLADNLAILTALANDEGYDRVFVHQLEGRLNRRDVVLGLSVSGTSDNIIEALRYAREQGAVTIGCCGFDGGVLKGIVDICLHIPTPNVEYGPVEDIFNILGHLIYSYLRLKRRIRP